MTLFPLYLSSVPLYLLIGLEIDQARILSESFEEMTVEEAREILGRSPETRGRVAWIFASTNRAKPPATFAIMTRGGTVGILQLEPSRDGTGKMTVRYRLAR